MSHAVTLHSKDWAAHASFLFFAQQLTIQEPFSVTKHTARTTSSWSENLGILRATCTRRVLPVVHPAALEWVVRNATKPAVATLSLGIPVGAWSQALETAVQRVTASGVLVVVAAGAHRNHCS